MVLYSDHAARRPVNRASQVVIVDDDVALGRQIVAYLARCGIPALHEDNGASAVDVIRHIRPDVVVMDIDMPGMDGIEAGKIVVAEAPSTRLILISGYIEQQRRAHAAGIDAFAIVDKPLPLHMLVRFIRNALGHQPVAATP